MAEENEGTDLSPPEDVNSDAGFGAALAERGLGPIEEEFPRSDEDRFVEREPAVPPPPGEPEGEAPAPEVGQAEPAAEVDPAVAELLAQYGDDPQAALAAYVKEHENRESLIGRQGQELGQLRETVARLEGRIDQATMAPQEPMPEPVSEELVSSLETMFEEQGPNQAMEWLADNRPDLIETGIRVWSDQDPFQAGRFAARYDSFLQEEQLAAEQPQQPQAGQVDDPILAQMRAREQFTVLADAARNQLQISDEAWPLVRDHVVEAFNDPNTSPLVKNAIISADPQTQFQGMVEIVRNAHGRAVDAQTQQAEAQAQAEAADEAEQRKLGAQVATGSLRPAPEGKSVQDMTSEERIALFKQSLLSAPSTSIQDGLTGI
jgi:hypothetical protein